MTVHRNAARLGVSSRTILVACALLVPPTVPSPAAAQAPEQEIRRLEEDAYGHYERKQWAECAAKFEAVHRMSRVSKYLFNIAACYGAAGRVTAAYHFYDRFVRSGPPPIPRDKAQQQLEQLARTHARTHTLVTLVSKPEGAIFESPSVAPLRLGPAPATELLALGDYEFTCRLPEHESGKATVRVKRRGKHEVTCALTPIARPAHLLLVGAPDGAAITIDGVSASPLPDGGFEVDAGPHEVAIEADGYQPWRRTVEVASGARLELEAELEAITPDPQPKTPEELAPVVVQDGDSGFEIPTATWATGAVALVSLSVGVAFGVFAADRARDAQALSSAGDPSSSAKWRSLVADTDAYSTVANVSYGIAGAAIITSTILLFALQDSDEPEPTTSVTPVALRHGAGVHLSIDF